MSDSRLWRLFQLFIVVIGVVLIGGHLLGQPTLLAFVETGSMEPTIDTGDGFVSLPAVLTGSPDVGDVVVFEAREIEDGSLTTHRVVDESSQGYVTQGDANAVTDQEAGEPLVQDAQIVATAIQINGEVVTIPRIGAITLAGSDRLEAVSGSVGDQFESLPIGFSELMTLLFVLSIVLLLRELNQGPDTEVGRSRRRESRSPTEPLDPRLIAGAFAALLVLASTAAMVVPAGSQSMDVISAHHDSDRPDVIGAGETDERSVPLQNGGFLPTITQLETNAAHVDVDQEQTVLGPRSAVDRTVTIEAPQETGFFPAYVTEYRYLYVLPAPVIERLHALQPWSPLVVINALLGAGFYLVTRAALDRTSTATNRRRRHSSRQVREGRA